LIHFSNINVFKSYIQGETKHIFTINVILHFNLTVCSLLIE